MTERAQQTTPSRETARRIIVAVVPLVVAAALGAFLWEGLSLRPREIPSALIGKPVPDFSLPPLPGREPGLASGDLKGEVSVVNVFASWCGPCRVEHPQLARLQQAGVPIHGINYKDRPEAALAWLAEEGDVYRRIGADQNGRVAIEWGVYGVPETFVVDAEGVIVCKHIGPLQVSANGKLDDVRNKILPAVEAARRGERPQC